MSIVSVTDALERRFSCRAFNGKPVPSETLTRLLGKAALSPFGTNLQPWQVHILTGQKKAELEQAVKEKFPLSIMGEGFDFRIYPEEMTDTLRARRFECGENLYRTFGIAREDKPGRIRQTMKNAEFFGAPVGMIITVDPCIAEAQLMDCGIFLQTVMLLAEEEGLGSCPQGFWALWPDTVRRVLRIENELVVVGLAIGCKGSDAIVNTVGQTRLPLDEFVTVYE